MACRRASSVNEFSYRCGRLKKACVRYFEKTTVSNEIFYALLIVDELHRTFLLISSVHIFV